MHHRRTGWLSVLMWINWILIGLWDWDAVFCFNATGRLMKLFSTFFERLNPRIFQIQIHSLLTYNNNIHVDFKKNRSYLR